MQIKNLKILYQNRLSFFGLSMILMSFYFFAPTIFTSKSSLISLEGTIKSANSLIETVSSTSKSGYEAKSRKASLTFSLKEYDKEFYISENLGNVLTDVNNNGFENVAEYLENSDSVIVWIKKSDLNNLSPKVFQVDVDGKTEFEFEKIKSEFQYVFIFLLVIGVLCIYVGDIIEKTKNK
jgi:hypothetical protein